MTHADRTFRKLVAGDRLSADDRRHIQTCAECQRARADAEALDRRLRDATRSLASAPIPDEVLDAEPMEPRWTDRLRLTPALIGAAAVVAAVAVGLAFTQIRPPVAVLPSPSATSTGSQAQSPTPEPTRTPPPSPSATPAPSKTDPYLVPPLGICADGDAGYSVFLPDGWYANAASLAEPACTTIGHVREVDGHQNLDPLIYLTRVEEAPTFEEASVKAHEHVTLPNGVEMDRYVVHVPETGAVAAEDSVTYIAPLLPREEDGPGGYLRTSTDSANAEAVAGLDEIMQRLELRESMTLSAETVAEAQALFDDRDLCMDDGRALAVIFPEAWWTNTAVNETPACSWFAPTSFQAPDDDEIPDEVDITVALHDGGYGTHSEAVGWETLQVMGHAATRWLLDDGTDRRYEYVVLLGEISELGPNLVASTDGNEDLSRAVLDEMMRRMSIGAESPPGATSDEPPISAPSVTAVDANEDFRLELTVEQDRYRAGQPILADAVLTYLGPESSVTLRGSGTGVVAIGLKQLDGPVDPGRAFPTDCRPDEMTPGEPMHVQFSKSGSFDGDDPLADFYRAYFDDPLLRLPPGRWQLTAFTAFELGGTDCGEGESVSLSAPIEITVEP